MKAKIGDIAPVFTVMNQDGKEVNLGDYLGKQAVVIYFYPKNFTPGCVAEACSFRDHYEDFTDLGAAVFGISGDSVSSHSRFVKRYNLPFTMLADKGGRIRKMYDVKGDLLGLLPGRETFIISADGVILMRFNSMQATKHIGKALDVLRKIDERV